MFYQILVAMLLLISAIYGYGQQTAVKELQVKSVETLSEEMPDELLPTAFTQDAMVMKKYRDESSLEVYLSDFNGNVIRQLDVIETSRPDRVFTSSTATRVIVDYQDLQSGKWMAKVYDLESNQSFVLRHEGGDVVTAIASPADGRILYQFRREGDAPKAFLAYADGQNAQFIADAFPVCWTPDGKGYILKSAKAGLTEAYKHGKITKQEYEQELQRRRNPSFTPKVRLWLYHQELKAPAFIPDLKDVNPRIVLSPRGQWMAIYDEGKLYISSFFFREGKIQFEDKKMIDQDNREYALDLDFAWDINGEKLVYVRLYLNETGEDYINSDVLIYDRSSAQTYALTNTPQIHERSPYWLPGGSLIIGEIDTHRRTGSVVKLTLQEN